MDYLCEVYSNIARLVIHNRQEQVFTPVSRYGTQTEYIVELKRNLRNRYKRNPQHNGRQNHSCVFTIQNINRTYYILGFQLLSSSLRISPNFQRQRTSRLEVHVNRAWVVLCLSVVWSLGGNLQGRQAEEWCHAFSLPTIYQFLKIFIAYVTRKENIQMRRLRPHLQGV